VTGIFLAIDGPNGVGKTTATRNAVEILRAEGLMAVATEEPTRTKLGQLARDLDGQFRSEAAYACLIAADRREHLTVIEDLLKEVDVVVSDRYLPSSLVLNVGWGVSEDFILSLHDRMRYPDLTVILTADPSELEARIAARGTIPSRGEQRTSRSDENRRYTDLAPRLAELGFPVRHLDTSNRPSHEVASTIVSWIMDLHE
jgi:dTMP kinase